MLTALEQPVVVVIDDVDRLRPDEVRHLFQLVKANADFPNLTYLLLFQRDVVEASIQEGTNGDGRQFLEKIIQVGFDVPPLESGRLYQALFDGLNRVLADDAVSKRFDQKHWQTIFPEMRSLFRNLRDVARFLGSLAFHVSLFRRGDSFEVNPVDLIAVEALRLFEPEVYSKVKDSKATLTSAGSQLGSHRNTKVDQAVIQAIFDAASDANREVVRELFKKLFPIVRSLLGGASYGARFSEAWFRESRVCHEQVFDRYFLLGLPANDVSQADLDFLIDNSQDVAVLSERLIQYAKTGQIEAVLDRLEAYKERLPAASLVPFITAIMNVGDFLPPRSPGMFAFSADLHASRIVHWALKTVSDPHERAARLVEACLLSDGIYLPLQRIAEQEARENTSESPERYFLSDEDIQKGKEAVLTRIRKRAAENLEAIPFLPYVLYRWKIWANPLEVETWVDQLLKRGGVTKFLGRFLSTATSTPIDGGPSTVHHRISLKALREFVSTEAIEIALGEIDLGALSEEERVAVTAFRRAAKRESEGKPEEDWGRDEEDDD